MTTPPRPDQPDSNNQPDQTGQQGQTNQPGNPFSQHGNAQGPVYGQQQPGQQQPGQQQPGQQQPVYGQQQAYGQQPGQYGPPHPGFGPPPGGPDNPTPPPSGLRSNKVIPIVVGCIAVAVLIAVVVGYLAFRDTDDGTSVDASPVGSCLTVESKELSNVETERTDCTDTKGLSYIVAAKKSDEKACEKAGLRFWVTEYGDGASDDILCLAPNYVQGNCYKESSTSIGLGLEAVPCTEESSIVSVVYKITERVKSTSVPNCTDPSKQRVYASKIDTGSDDALGVCAVIQGDYTWTQE
ncbi:LppU/SCO3897 family protein [Gordonia sp. (in: high G+C Gram-positive bacteria)]|uniref:LppU/SCO3897 family protein n=1 Tax=Gordonia sp. (in: high G+C Gram-positive bacteria) TaxID=84139 RepID=UPI003F9E4B91